MENNMMTNYLNGLEVTESYDTQTPWISQVFERADGNGFIAYHKSPGGSVSCGSVTRSGAFARLVEYQDHTRDFWREKVAWLCDGDRTESGSHAIRIDGHHYTATPGIVSGNTSFRGHGGRLFRWCELDSGEVYESNNVWHQGQIPPEFQELLPNNAVWVKELATKAINAFRQISKGYVQ